MKSSRLTKSCRDQLDETLFAKYSNIRCVLASFEHLSYQPAKLDHPAPPQERAAPVASICPARVR